MIISLVVSLVIVSFVRSMVVHNDTSITDFGTTTLLNQTKDTVVTAANYTTDDMVETSCHIISEQLVATATATVSSAFSDLCRTDQVTGLLLKLENKFIKELDMVKYKVDRIMKHFMILESDSPSNSTT